MSIKEQIQKYYDFWFGITLIYEKWAKAHGLTSNMLFILYTIREMPEACTQQKICQKLMLPKQTVNSILMHLEKSGYIKREISSQDKRRKIITFTKEGQLLSEGILTQLYQFEKAALSRMTPQERVHMTESCHKFLEQLEYSFYGEEN